MATAADYLALNGRLQVRDQELLTASTVDAMLDAATGDEAMARLRETAVAAHLPASGTPSGEVVEQAFEAHLQEAFELIQESAPEEIVVQLVRARFNWHNSKVVAKVALSGLGLEGQPVSSLGDWSTEQMLAILEDRPATTDDEALPEEAIETLRAMKRAGIEDPQWIDLLGDAAWARHWKMIASSARQPILKQLVGRLHDLHNLRVAARLLDRALSEEFLHLALVDAPTISADALKTILLSEEAREERAAQLQEQLIALPDVEALIEPFRLAVEGRSFGELERAIEDEALRQVAAGRNEMFGVLPALGFLLGKERELTNLRIILTGKRFGVEREEIAKRLRVLY